MDEGFFLAIALAACLTFAYNRNMQSKPIVPIRPPGDHD